MCDLHKLADCLLAYTPLDSTSAAYRLSLSEICFCCSCSTMLSSQYIHRPDAGLWQCCSLLPLCCPFAPWLVITCTCKSCCDRKLQSQLTTFAYCRQACAAYPRPQTDMPVVVRCISSSVLDLCRHAQGQQSLYQLQY